MRRRHSRAIFLQMQSDITKRCRGHTPSTDARSMYAIMHKIVTGIDQAFQEQELRVTTFLSAPHCYELFIESVSRYIQGHAFNGLHKIARDLAQCLEVPVIEIGRQAGFAGIEDVHVAWIKQVHKLWVHSYRI